MRTFDWTGNVRQLKNEVQRAVLMAEGHFMTADDLSLVSSGEGPEGDAPPLQLRLPPEGIDLEDLEKQANLEALRVNNWVQKDAARFLGISSRVMNYKVAKYEIKSPRWSKNKLVN